MKHWILPIGAACLAALASLAVYAQLPAEMAIHFGIDQAPDNWASRPVGAFLLPVLIIAVAALISLSAKFEKNESKRLRSQAAIGSVITVMSAALLTVHLFVLAYNLGYSLSVSTFASILVGVIFISLGNVMPKLPQRAMQWPKLPEDKHRKLARFQGRFMVIMGIVFLFIAFLPGTIILPIFLILLVLFIFIVLGISIRYGR